MSYSTLLPVNLKEAPEDLSKLIAFIKKFGTKKIILIHNLADSSIKKDEAENKLQEFKTELSKSDVDCEYHLVNGELPVEVNRLMAELEIDFITLNWRPKNAIKRTVMGSLDSDILRLCDYPIFIYKHHGFFGETKNLEKVLYATDLSDPDARYQKYLDILGKTAEKLYILHVRERAPDPLTDEKRLEETNDRIAQKSRYCQTYFRQTEEIVAVGSTRKEIARQASRNGINLIVIGKQGSKSAKSKVLGATAEDIPHRTNSCIFIIP